MTTTRAGDVLDRSVATLISTGNTEAITTEATRLYTEFLQERRRTSNAMPYTQHEWDLDVAATRLFLALPYRTATEIKNHVWNAVCGI